MRYNKVILSYLVLSLSKEFYGNSPCFWNKRFFLILDAAAVVVLLSLTLLLLLLLYFVTLRNVLCL